MAPRGHLGFVLMQIKASRTGGVRRLVDVANRRLPTMKPTAGIGGRSVLRIIMIP